MVLPCPTDLCTNGGTLWHRVQPHRAPRPAQQQSQPQTRPARAAAPPPTCISIRPQACSSGGASGLTSRPRCSTVRQAAQRPSSPRGMLRFSICGAGGIRHGAGCRWLLSLCCTVGRQSQAGANCTSQAPGGLPWTSPKVSRRRQHCLPGSGFDMWPKTLAIINLAPATLGAGAPTPPHPPPHHLHPPAPRRPRP